MSPPHRPRILTGMSDAKWTPADIPDQTGRRAIITGGNSGIGFYAAVELARHGAQVVITARDPAKGADAKSRILAEVPTAQVVIEALDLASLASVEAFAERQTGKLLHLLINNAGVYAPPKRRETADGFELQFGTNVLGHFALTARLLPLIAETATTAGNPPRIVTIASIAHKGGKLNFDDLQAERTYSPDRSYGQSKLANLVLAFELDRRLRAAHSPILSIAAHPGVSNTNLFQGSDYRGLQLKVRRFVSVLIGALLNNQPEGAIPTLFAATSPAAQASGYYGPQSFFETRGGDVGPAKVAPHACDLVSATRLWAVCEQLTGISLL